MEHKLETHTLPFVLMDVILFPLKTQETFPFTGKKIQDRIGWVCNNSGLESTILLA